MKILMICLGNICRSPMAEAIMRSKLPSDYFVDSAGTFACQLDIPPDDRAILTASKHGLDISNLRSRKLAPKDFEEFDYLYCMDFQNYKDTVSKAQNEEQKRKVSLITEAANLKETPEVPDPYYGKMQDFENVYQMLDKACIILAQQIVQKEK